MFSRFLEILNFVTRFQLSNQYSGSNFYSSLHYEEDDDEDDEDEDYLTDG